MEITKFALAGIFYTGEPGLEFTAVNNQHSLYVLLVETTDNSRKITSLTLGEDGLKTTHDMGNNCWFTNDKLNDKVEKVDECNIEKGKLENQMFVINLKNQPLEFVYPTKSQGKFEIFSKGTKNLKFNLHPLNFTLNSCAL